MPAIGETRRAAPSGRDDARGARQPAERGEASRAGAVGEWVEPAQIGKAGEAAVARGHGRGALESDRRELGVGDGVRPCGAAEDQLTQVTGY